LATNKLAVASRQRTVSHFFFNQEMFDQNQDGCRLHPPYFFVFPRFKTKLKGRHFETAEVMEAEAQAVLNSLTGHNFQDAFKNDRSTETVHIR
jgi:hypothetical protein